MSLTICNDGHRCLNGGLCTPNPNDDGAFYCDCDGAVSVVSGLSCEHEATTYCTYNQEVSKVSFCTNKGECQVDDSHVACICKDGYEGEHCQFIEGSTEKAFYENTLTKSAPHYSLRATEGGDSDGVVILVVVLVVLVLAGAVLYVYNKKRMLSTPMMKAKDSNIPIGSAEMALDSDGGVLQEAVKSLEEANGNAHTTDQVITGSTNSSIPNESDNEDYNPEATNNGNEEKGQMEDIQISNSNEIL
mmetsp:Transcript_29246/g.32367  ORF Transcript_29246/g.32367 Transcript_29246/m.32367 type:complete len:246 (-) Transcript_29246:72-809(-)